MEIYYANSLGLQNERLPNALALPFRANCPTRADLFRQIIRDHFDRWCDLRLDDEVPADQQAYVRETVQRSELNHFRTAGLLFSPGYLCSRALPADLGDHFQPPKGAG